MPKTSGDDFLLYGANGYTGRLILERAVAVGLRPVIAGRSAASVLELAERHALPHAVLGLDDPVALLAAVRRVPLVVHAAGPFSRTARPVVEACLAAGAHYVDITGEIEVFTWIHEQSARARAAGVMLLPGAGFDVVPTDCLAAHLKRRLPSATHLRLAFTSHAGISRGTALTMLDGVADAGCIRADGELRRVPMAWRTRRVDFGFGMSPKDVTTIPWGDVATAYYSTSIPNIEVYTRMGSAARRLLRVAPALTSLLRAKAVQRLARRAIASALVGPNASRRAQASAFVWGEVEDEGGGRAAARMRMPEGYTLTAMTTVAVAQRVLAGDAPPGFQTPSSAYGADWPLALPGVERQDA